LLRAISRGRHQSHFDRLKSVTDVASTILWNRPPSLQMGASKMERVGGGAPEAHNVHVASSGVQLTILGKIDHPNMQP
jgi:hypothetical protein